MKQKYHVFVFQADSNVKSATGMPRDVLLDEQRGDVDRKSDNGKATGITNEQKEIWTTPLKPDFITDFPKK